MKKRQDLWVQRRRNDVLKYETKVKLIKNFS